MIEPFEAHATASFFYVEDEPVVIASDEAAYRARVMPHSHMGAGADPDLVVDAMIDKGNALLRLLGKDELKWL